MLRRKEIEAADGLQGCSLNFDSFCGAEPTPPLPFPNDRPIVAVVESRREDVLR